MQPSTTQKKAPGFTLVELIIVVAIIMIVAVISVPKMLNIMSDINLRYFATNYTGLLQSARMQAVRKNAYYQVKPTSLPTGGTGYYVHAQGAAYAAGDPLLPLGTQITVYNGTGSGAPNETAFTNSFTNFTVYSGSNHPSFNARGLPCIVASGVCSQNAGQGFVVFMSKPAPTGNIAWASVVITPSGHMQIWTYDGTAWIQRD
jgi:prepilin-type N-terminal cleavage/methylation domain-containing protein